MFRPFRWIEPLLYRQMFAIVIVIGLHCMAKCSQENWSKVLPSFQVGRLDQDSFDLIFTANPRSVPLINESYTNQRYIPNGRPPTHAVEKGQFEPRAKLWTFFLFSCVRAKVVITAANPKEMKKSRVWPNITSDRSFSAIIIIIIIIGMHELILIAETATTTTFHKWEAM